MSLAPFDPLDPCPVDDDDDEEADDAPQMARSPAWDEFVFYKVCGCGLPVPRHLQSYERDWPHGDWPRSE